MTSVARSGTLQSQNFISLQISRNTSSYVNLQEQVTTGYKTQRFAGIADESAMVVNLDNSEMTLDQYVKAADATTSRLSAAHSGLSNILDVITDFRAKLLQAMTSEQADDGRIDVVADGYLEEIEAALNTNLGGVYVFGGTKNDTPPVDLSDPIANGAGTYYSGAGAKMQTRIDSNTVISYGTTADRQGFKDVIASLQRVSSASGNLTELETALDDLNASLNDLTQLEAEIGHDMEVVERSQTRNKAVQVTVVNQLSTLRDVDISAAMVSLTQRETILQASYSVIARQNELSLVNYLR